MTVIGVKTIRKRQREETNVSPEAMIQRAVSHVRMKKVIRKRRVPVNRKLDSILGEIDRYMHTSGTFQGIRPRNVYQQALEGAFDTTSDDRFGDQLLIDIVRTMGEFKHNGRPIRLRSDQQTMAKHAINALLPLIYGPKLEASRKRLLKQLGLERITQEIMILASRRVGKTYFVAMLLASCMICFPAIEIACFSLALRTSQKMMRLVVDFLNMHEKGRYMIIKHNQEQLILRGDTLSTYKILHSFPDKADVCIVFFLFIYSKQSVDSTKVCVIFVYLLRIGRGRNNGEIER